jgi:hypothetical protein
LKYNGNPNAKDSVNIIILMRDIVRKHSNALCSVKQELEHGKVVE